MEDIIYECDPDKNKECDKSGCHINGFECHNTIHSKYAKNEGITFEEWIKEHETQYLKVTDNYPAMMYPIIRGKNE